MPAGGANSEEAEERRRQQEQDGDNGDADDLGEYADDQLLKLLPPHVLRKAKTMGWQEFASKIAKVFRDTDGQGPGPSQAGNSNDGDSHNEGTVTISDLMRILQEERSWLKDQSKKTPAPQKPALFDGQSSGADFLEQFHFYVSKACLSSPTNTDYVNHFHTLLNGAAQRWYLKLPITVREDWSALLTQFKEKFVDYFTDERALAYRNKYQGPHESAASYCNEMDNLLTDADLSPPVALHVFIDHMKPTLREIVTKKKPTTTAEAAQIAKDYESLFSITNRHAHPNQDWAFAGDQTNLVQAVIDKLQTNNSVRAISQAGDAHESLVDEICEQVTSKMAAKGKGRQQPKQTVAALTTEAPSQGKKKPKKKKEKHGTQTEQCEQRAAQSGTNHNVPAQMATTAPVFPPSFPPPAPGQPPYLMWNGQTYVAPPTPPFLPPAKFPEQKSHVSSNQGNY